MRKIFTMVISCIVGLNMAISSLPVLAADENGREKDNYTVVQNYNVIEEPVEVTYVDPNKVQNNNSARINATYVKTVYTVSGTKLITYDAKELTDEMFLVSVPEGYSIKLEDSKTVSGSMSIHGAAEATVGEKKAVAGKFSLEGTGTISQTYSVGQTFSFPNSYIGEYGVANYYTAIGYDLYNVTIEAYDIYNIETINHPITTNERTYTVQAYIPKVVLYTVGANY